MSWTRDLDEAANLATSKGSWHVALFYLLCGLAAIPTSFLVFSQVFTNATPEHWCAPPPELEGLLLPEDLLRNLTVPQHDGVYESCVSYDVDPRALFAALHDYVDERTEILHEGGALQMIKTHRLLPAEGVEERKKQISRVVEAVTVMRSRPTPCSNGWRFSAEQYTRTLVTEYSLVCDKEWLARTSYTLFWVGSIFGNLFFGWMSDRFGRRPTILIMIYLEVPLAIIGSFPTSYSSYIAMRMIGGLFFPAMYQLPFILALELMPPARRTTAGIVVGMLFAAGMSLLALIAYAVQDWYHLSLATSIPFIFLYGCYWLIPESPRWLVGRGRILEAENVLRELARKNGINLRPGFLLGVHKKVTSDKDDEERQTLVISDRENIDEFPKILDINHSDQKINNIVASKPDITITSEYKKDAQTIENTLHSIKRDKNNQRNRNKMLNAKNFGEKAKSDTKRNSSMDNFKKESLKLITRILFKKEEVQPIENNEPEKEHVEEECEASAFDLFRYANIRKKFLILTFDWLSLGVIYNSLSYNTSNLGVNDYIAFFIGGAVELPSYIIAWLCMERFGRRWVLCVFMWTGGLACLCCVFIPEEMPWITVSFAMLGRLCAAAAFAVFYVLIGELLPTVIRAQAMGLASFISGLGLLACPYIVHLAVYGRSLPLIAVGVLSIVAGATSLFLPETLHQPLPQTLRDGEAFGRSVKLFDCTTQEEE